MFADPVSITINAVAQSFAAVSRSDNRSVYKTADDTYTLEISQDLKDRRRRIVRLSQTKITADPYKPSENVQVQASVTLTINEPIAGFSDTELDYLIGGAAGGLKSWLTAGNVAKVAGGET